VTATGTGNAQWLSYTAIMTKETGMDIRLVQESAPANRFKSVQTGQYFATSGSSGDFQNIVEALETYATADGGPFPMRILWGTGMAWSGFLATNASGIKTPADIKAGVRMGDTVNSPNVRSKQLGSLLAWANLTPDKVTWVPFSDYNATVRGLGEGKIDVAFAFPTSPVVLELGDKVHYIELDPAKDPEGAKRYLDVDPVTAFAKVLEGPTWLQGAWAKGSATGSITIDKSDEALVYNMAKWLDTNYDKYKDAHPQNKYMTRDTLMQLVNTAFIPVHPGTIKYLKEIGLWKPANDTRQQQNIDLVNKWIAAYDDAKKQATAKGLKVDPANKDWLAFWAQYKIDNKVPIAKTYLGL